MIKYASNEIDNQIAYNFRDLGIFNLKASASAQFSEEELKNIIELYPQHKLNIIDLRFEYHGFINGKPLTFRNMYKKTDLFDSQQEKNILEEIVKNKNLLISNPFFALESNQDIDIKQALTEQQLVEKYHCNYYRFSLKDHHFPDFDQFQKIIDFLKEIENDPKQRIHVHCAAGRGRTAIFLVIYDILKNFKNSTLTDIFSRQARLGGANLANIAYEDEWPNDQKQNIQMLYDFYEQLNQS